MLLFIPFALLRRSHTRETKFAHFLEWGRQCLPGHLPEQLGKASFIYFEPGSDWTARTLAYRREALATHPHADLLRRLARDKAFRPQPLISLFVWILITILGLFVLLLLGFLFLMSRR